MSNTDIDVACRITTAGGWLNLMASPYRLSAEAFVEEAVTWRRQEVQNAFVEGSWLVGAVRENITAAVDVYVRCVTTTELALAVKALQSAFSQINYGLELTVNGVTYYYQCYAADYTIKTSREFRASTMAQFAAQVSYNPTYEVKTA